MAQAVGVQVSPSTGYAFLVLRISVLSTNWDQKKADY